MLPRLSARDTADEPLNFKGLLRTWQKLRKLITFFSYTSVNTPSRELPIAKYMHTPVLNRPSLVTDGALQIRWKQMQKGRSSSDI